jgi:DNA processing protein
MSACDDCLRRSALVASLASHIELAADRERSPVQSVLALPDAELIDALAGETRRDIVAAHRAFDAQAARRSAVAARLTTVCRCDDSYPDALDHLPDPPAVLHVWGELAAIPTRTRDAVSIVGARRATSYGLEVARSLGRELAQAGMVVVSGMALGCDSAAHEGALEARGVTVAVLAGAAERPYPASKRHIHAALAATGCAVSEFPPGFRAHRWCFVARNRVIAALSHMTVVVEATERSGSLITAARAREIGREVGAVPGRITTRAAGGANALLSDGATVVRGAQDVLDAVCGVGERPLDLGAARRALMGPDLREVLDAIGDGQNTVSALARGPADLQRVRGVLGELELLGYLRREPSGRYVPLL